MQYYIDDLVDTPVFTFDGLVDYKVKDRDYTKELEILRFYIDSGATVGKNNNNGWKYMMNSLNRGTNPYLLKCLHEKYAAFIK